MSIIFSTHVLHPKATEMLAQAGQLRIASAPDGDTLLREGTDADILIVRAPIPIPLFFSRPPAPRRNPPRCRRRHDPL